VKPVPVEELRRTIAECTRPGRTRRPAPSADELIVMREYNVALVRKLEEKNAELQGKIATLEAAERQLTLQATALHGAASAIVITDARATIVWVNPAFTAITGYAPAEAVGQTTRLLRSGAHPPAFYAELWRTVLAGRSWQGEFVNRRKDGTLFHGEQTITPVRGTPLPGRGRKGASALHRCCAPPRGNRH
jgi:PAS domain S-box-containing protein